ncbi:NAD(P)H-quinone oxidoreductase subunit D/H [Syntrophomonas zehnderi OL-4]|uniref:NADH-quinone oxidoreductase subunit D n=1 Tax=Syntrophomonas zehnderi OL-4 TaxID=690567 RepID=A0A0E4GCX5_9FIRM|nr:NADH-quinone oxidoreductase subunit D [Syntrophomonas zehnderi]CFX28818.1 NAD(P)H-quinone oxidoreductase subunit D/H [Syntrophomonas zehnderi OL-4]
MLRTEQFTINIGPQHPSTHGGLHVEAVMDGEFIVDAIVHLGYVHRSVEKIAESRTYPQYVPYTSRLDYLASHLPTLGYCQAVEKMLGVAVPERAEYIRIIMAEFSRIASHLLFIGSCAIDLGATTGLIYCLRDRERIMDMFEMTSGQRLIASYMRIGGVSEDLPDTFIPAARSFIADFPEMIAEYDGLIIGNEILQARLKGVGRLNADDAIAYGVSGPNLRACGIDYDIRKAEPYGIYDRFDFTVPLAENGDSWDRLLVRMEEMQQSIHIIEQALNQLPEGEVKAKVPRIIKPAEGIEVYHRIESSKGELGYYIVADGGEKPYRLHVRAPSFINLMVLPMISKGGKLQDIIANIATLDPVLGESDR